MHTYTSGEDIIINKGEIIEAGVLPLQDSVPFPCVTSPISLGRPGSIALARKAYTDKEFVFIVSQKTDDKAITDSEALCKIGVLARVHDIITLPDGTEAALVETYNRGELKEISEARDEEGQTYKVNPRGIPMNHDGTLFTPQTSQERKMHLIAKVEALEAEGIDEENMRIKVLVRMIIHKFRKMVDMFDEKDTSELRRNLRQLDATPYAQLNFIAYHAPIDKEAKQYILDAPNTLERLTRLLTELNKAHEFMKMREEIQRQTGSNLQQQQKEQFLQMQMRAIQDELGNNVEDSDYTDLLARSEKMQWSAEANVHFERELKKLERFNVQNPEYSVQYSYLDLLLSLPWNTHGPTEVEMQKVKDVLEADHYGLEDVKDRILEQVAVMKLRKDMRAPILCLYGPPGVGKTSLGKSVARALGREYARISLGGLHDEAEIRGHRRTYIGAMPGRIISALKKCKTDNPVFVLDEIDKIGKDFKGDPSTALLEVLDPEQNSKFHDNYVDFDYDLSNVMFIATANDLGGISRPLLDRMEMIEITGYVLDEKLEIAKRHLVPKVIEELGFAIGDVEFTDEALRRIIERYTRESGVRLLEKKIAKALRKVAVKKAEGKEWPNIIDADTLTALMGPEEIIPDVYEDNRYIGVVTGLAWTQVGGEILYIEVSLSPGKGEKLTLTGSLGDVMKESAVIALQYLKAHSKEFGIDPSKFHNYDVHIHVPEGAVPKDGPSAGITIATALASAFTDRKVKNRIAMTGEITLRGKVLPVGGIKEKILAAKRAGITEIILCEDNKRDINKIAPRYLEGLDFVYVKEIADVLKHALI